jgi:hypothetical protein
MYSHSWLHHLTLNIRYILICIFNLWRTQRPIIEFFSLNLHPKKTTNNYWTNLVPRAYLAARRGLMLRAEQPNKPWVRGCYWTFSCLCPRPCAANNLSLNVREKKCRHPVAPRRFASFAENGPSKLLLVNVL